MSRSKLLSMLIANPSCDKKIYVHNWLPYFQAKELKWLFHDLEELGFLRRYPDHFELTADNMRTTDRMKDERFVTMRYPDAEIVKIYRHLDFYEVRSRSIGITLGIMKRTTGQAWGSAKRYIIGRERDA